MSLAKFKTEIHRQEFIHALRARGYKEVPPVREKQPIGIGTFRVYNYTRKAGSTTELRVSYWQPRQGPIRKIPTPLPPHEHKGGMACLYHADRKAHSRGLCANCYHRWQYWFNAEFRKRKRLAMRRAKRDQMREAA